MMSPASLSSFPRPVLVVDGDEEGRPTASPATTGLGTSLLLLCIPFQSPAPRVLNNHICFQIRAPTVCVQIGLGHAYHCAESPVNVLISLCTPSRRTRRSSCTQRGTRDLDKWAPTSRRLASPLSRGPASRQTDRICRLPYNPCRDSPSPRYPSKSIRNSAGDARRPSDRTLRLPLTSSTIPLHVRPTEGPTVCRE